MILKDREKKCPICQNKLSYDEEFYKVHPLYSSIAVECGSCEYHLKFYYDISDLFLILSLFFIVVITLLHSEYLFFTSFAQHMAVIVTLLSFPVIVKILIYKSDRMDRYINKRIVKRIQRMLDKNITEDYWDNELRNPEKMLMLDKNNLLRNPMK